MPSSTLRIRSEKSAKSFCHFAQQRFVSLPLLPQSSPAHGPHRTRQAPRDGSASIRRPTESRADPPVGGPWCGARAVSRCGLLSSSCTGVACSKYSSTSASPRCCCRYTAVRLAATFPPSPLPSAPDLYALGARSGSASRLAAIINSRFHSASTASAYFPLRTSPCSVMRTTSGETSSGCARIAECVGPRRGPPYRRGHGRVAASLHTLAPHDATRGALCGVPRCW